MTGGRGGDDPTTLLADVPPVLWGDLLRALRRAMERMGRSELPAGLRPFSGWRPDKLAADRPRAAAARALTGDPGLRELVADALEDRRAYDAAADADARRLAAEHGDEAALAALVARGRWEDVAVVAGDAAERRAARDRASAEDSRRRRSQDAGVEHRRLTDALSEARAERDALRRRVQAADRQRRQTAEELARVSEELARARSRTEQLEAELDEERRRRESRTARLRRRLEEAQARVRVDDERARAVLADLEGLSARLREALSPPEGASAEPPATRTGADASAVPRDVPAAEPGRPCRLPDGVGEDAPLAVRSLLKVAGLEVLLDGYNVSKDAGGQPAASLEQQRQWLVRLCGGVAGRCRCRHTVVFDGTDPRLAPVPSARDVRVAYTSGDETADERLVTIVAGLPPDQPVLVVTSDRAVRAACEGLGANTAPAGSYLVAVGA